MIFLKIENSGELIGTANAKKNGLMSVEDKKDWEDVF